MSEIRVYINFKSLVEAAAEQVVRIANLAVAERGSFYIALSGGSTPRALYERLAHPDLASKVDWTKVHIFWGDERCVSHDDPESNYRLAKETLLDRIPLPPGNIHPIQGELEPELAAREYEQEIIQIFGQSSTMSPLVPAFDLILLGMGEDGHTASLFPGSPALLEEKRWVAAVEHNTPPPPLVSRVTLTPVLINSANNVIFLISGKSKAKRLRAVLEGEFNPERLPAQIINPKNGNLFWMLDKAAAKLIQTERENISFFTEGV